MSGGQGKSFINLGSKLRESIAQQDYAIIYGDKYVEFVVQTTVYTELFQVVVVAGMAGRGEAASLHHQYPFSE